MEADEMGMKVTDFHYTNISDVENRPIFEITVFLANPFLGNFGKSVGLPTR